ncbi:MAG: hypothetical protein K2Q21_12315 [Chitinophagaceae bacterium]|nr:hypothetical protein [Chitinophagaceae bacterium]
MEIPELTIKLIILLIPGAIASLIFEKLTIHKKWNSFQFVANSILFGGISYLFAQLAFNLCGSEQSFANFWSNLPSKEIPYEAVIKAIVTSVLIGFICAGLDNYKIINKIGKSLKLTTKYGDENLYPYFLNANNINEIYFRDIKNNITYHGMINSFSETDEFKEIVLSDVKVYDYSSSTLMYELDKVYLSRPKDDIIIEVPFTNKPKNETNGGETKVETP